VLLAAGRGRRLLPITERVAKPLVPLLNVPLLYWMVAGLLRAGASHLVANVHTHHEQFDAAADRLDARGIAMLLVYEPEPSGPAGGLAACREELPDAPACLVVSGDAVTDQHLDDLVEAHGAWNSDMTIMSMSVADPSRFGVLRLDGTRLKGYAEDSAGAPPGAQVSCGIYVLSRRALAALDPSPGVDYDFKHVVPALLDAGMSVHAFSSRAYWNDVGEPRALLDANLSWLSPSRLSAVARPANDGEFWTQDDALPGRFTARHSLVGHEARIGAEGVLDHCVVGAGARVGEGARLRDCLLMPEAVVPAGHTATGQVIQ
jgi:mannose-1-phosphate guanylyltransferase